MKQPITWLLIPRLDSFLYNVTEVEWCDVPSFLAGFLCLVCFLRTVLLHAPVAGSSFLCLVWMLFHGMDVPRLATDPCNHFGTSERHPVEAFVTKTATKSPETATMSSFNLISFFRGNHLPGELLGSGAEVC